MKITIVGPTHPYKGGVSQHTTELARRLASAGEDVDLVSWSSQYPKRFYPGQLELSAPDSEAAFPNTRRVLAWNRPWTWWRGAGGRTAEADLVAFALVNPLQVPAYSVLVGRLKMAGVRTIAICHNVHPHDAGKAQVAANAAFLRLVDAVVVHSETEAELARAHGVGDVRVARLPFFFPEAAMPQDRYHHVRRRLLSFGFVRPYKGVDVLIDAVARMRHEVSITVAGEFWVPVDELRARAERLGIGDRVDLRDEYLEPDAIGRLLAEHDALVLSYRSGTGSQQPQIAFLARRPVVASRVGDLASQIRDGVDGLLVSPDDPDELARALDSLYEDDLLERLRSEVRGRDVDAEWKDYRDALITGGEDADEAHEGRSSLPARTVRSAISYVPSPSLLRARRARDLPDRWRGRPHELDFNLLSHFEWTTPRVVDVGANRGQTIESLRCVLDDPRITAVEPNPILARQLGALYGESVDVRAVGIGHEPGQFDLHIPRYGHTLWDTRASLDPDEARAFLSPAFFAGFRPARAGLEEVVVRVVPLDSLELEPSLLKMDVEGMDLEAVQGALRTIQRCTPVMMIERPQGRTVDELREHGYSPYRYDHESRRLLTDDTDGLNTFFLTETHIATLEARGVHRA